MICFLASGKEPCMVQPAARLCPPPPKDWDKALTSTYSLDRKLTFTESYPLVLAGGVFRACPSLYDRVESNLDLPKAEVVRLDKEPATGAVTLALELLS